MKKIFIIILFLFVSLFGASINNQYIETVKCPSQNFSKFLHVFSENASIQKAFTKNPLEKLQLDLDANPEPKPFSVLLDHKQIFFPILPNKDNREKNNLILYTKKINNKKVRLTLEKPDTDYQVIYIFKQNDLCWLLERIEDSSL